MSKGAPRSYVPHPRYGIESEPSGYDIPLETIRSSYWAYSLHHIFPKSALPADSSRQNFSTFPRLVYVDMLQTCRACKREFIFFAREQQFWYEELKLYVDCNCIYCCECRGRRRKVRSTLKRYSELAGRTTLNTADFSALLADFAFLWTAGVLCNDQRLRTLLNQARKRLPGAPETAQIEQLVLELESKPPLR